MIHTNPVDARVRAVLKFARTVAFTFYGTAVLFALFMLGAFIFEDAIQVDNVLIIVLGVMITSAFAGGATHLVAHKLEKALQQP